MADPAAAEGLATYVAIMLTWHPLLAAGLALLATAARSPLRDRPGRQDPLHKPASLIT